MHSDWSNIHGKCHTRTDLLSGPLFSLCATSNILCRTFPPVNAKINQGTVGFKNLTMNIPLLEGDPLLKYIIFSVKWSTPRPASGNCPRVSSNAAMLVLATAPTAGWDPTWPCLYPMLGRKLTGQPPAAKLTVWRRWTEPKFVCYNMEKLWPPGGCI